MLDSTAAVAAERQGKNARQLLEAIALEGDDEIGLSVMTALELGYGVGTANVRHFRLIPGLKVVQL